MDDKEIERVVEQYVEASAKVFERKEQERTLAE